MRPVCAILAGGRSSRMGGGDKGLLPLDGVPMLRHVVSAVTPQASAAVIISNSPAALFAEFRLPVVRDCVPGYQGPLAGLLTGMIWARRRHPRCTHILSVPCDTPFLPADLAARLAHGLADGGEIAIARDAEHVHHTLGLWPVALAERLDADLTIRGMRRVRAWLEQFAVKEIPFDGAGLRNINTPEDLAALCASPTGSPVPAASGF